MTKQFTFKKIDAFATRNSSGNPAGCIYLKHADDISVPEMQRIARELKGFVSEVAYISPSSEDNITFRLRYYSSEREVEFCGHATIASMYDIICHDEYLKQENVIHIATSKGTLAVENRLSTDDAVFITAPDPEFLTLAVHKKDIARALNVRETRIPATYPVSFVNAGLNTLIVPIDSLEEILCITPDFMELKEFCVRNTIDIITVFTDKVAHSANRFRTRVFAPTFGYLEDPATGSGNSAFGYYLMREGFWNGDLILLEQNAMKEQANIVKLCTRLDEHEQQRVLFGGGAIVRIEGEYLLHSRD